jgi:hypothetical protein
VLLGILLAALALQFVLNRIGEFVRLLEEAEVRRQFSMRS